jgi:hypothetical protein
MMGSGTEPEMQGIIPRMKLCVHFICAWLLQSLRFLASPADSPAAVPVGCGSQCLV